MRDIANGKCCTGRERPSKAKNQSQANRDVHCSCPPMKKYSFRIGRVLEIWRDNVPISARSTRYRGTLLK